MGAIWRKNFPSGRSRCLGSRNTATNHIVGDGWWSWWIPLKGGDVSVGVVFDQRLAPFPAREAQARRSPARDFWCSIPWRGNCSPTRNGSRATCIGGRISPMSAGRLPAMVLRWWAMPRPFSTRSTARAWTGFRSPPPRRPRSSRREQRGEPLAPLIEQHNAHFRQSYRRWFEAIYKDKYEYLGEFDLMRLAFRMDLGLYYLGIVSQPFKYGAEALSLPPFSRAGLHSRVLVHALLQSRGSPPSRAKRRAREPWGRENSGRNSCFRAFPSARRICRGSLAALRMACWNCAKAGAVGLERAAPLRSRRNSR